MAYGTERFNVAFTRALQTVRKPCYLVLAYVFAAGVNISGLVGRVVRLQIPSAATTSKDAFHRCRRMVRDLSPENTIH